MRLVAGVPESDRPVAKVRGSDLYVVYFSLDFPLGESALLEEADSPCSVESDDPRTGETRNDLAVPACNFRRGSILRTGCLCSARSAEFPCRTKN